MRKLSTLALLSMAGLLCACQSASGSQPTAAAPEATATQLPEPVQHPDFYFGADLSYVNEMEDCGATYLDGGEERDPFELFAAHGTNLVRARLWHNPDWTQYSTLADVKKTFQRAQETGMETLLDFHYSDTWADPSAQGIPAAWEAIESDEDLAQALYQYTYDTLMDLADEGLMPDFVQVGNETNPGLLKGSSMRQDWERDALLFNAGIRAVRDAAAASGADTRVLLHVAQPENTGWWFREAVEAGLTDFDVIGISYYPQWSAFSISGLASQIADLRRTYDKDVMVLETGYPWTLEAADPAGNVLTGGQRGYPISREGQLKFMLDLSQALRSSGALGSVYWEPAWVSTGCSTRWGQGSHWENAAFFDFQAQDELLPVIGYTSAEYIQSGNLPDGVIEAEYGSPLGDDATGDTLNARSELDLLRLSAYQADGFVNLAISLAGDAMANPGSIYRIYFDTAGDENGGNVDIGDRPIVVSEPNEAEFILEIQIVEANGTVVPEGAWFGWDGSAWQESAFVGNLAVNRTAPSVIEVSLAKAWLGNPASINLAALSAGRVLNRTAADILGADPTPSEPTATAELHSFFALDLTE